FLDFGPGAAWVSIPGSLTTYDVIVKRRRHTYGNNKVGVTFRVQDKDSRWQAMYGSDLGGVRIGYWSGNSFTAIQTTDPASSTWDYLGVKVSPTSIRAYVDDGAGSWTAVAAAISDSTHFQT